MEPSGRRAPPCPPPFTCLKASRGRGRGAVRASGAAALPIHRCQRRPAPGSGIRGRSAGRASRGRRRRGSRPFLRGALPRRCSRPRSPRVSPSLLFTPLLKTAKEEKKKKKKKKRRKRKKKVKRANGSWKTFAAAHAPRAGLLQTGLDFKAVRQRAGHRRPRGGERPPCECPARLRTTGPVSLAKLGVKPRESKLLLQSNARCAHPGRRGVWGVHGPSSTTGCSSRAGMGAHVHPCKPVCTHTRTCTPMYAPAHSRALQVGPAALPLAHMCTQCAAHMAAPSVPAGGPGTSPACRMLRGAERAACQRGDRASSTARVPPPAAAFWRCKFGKLLTKVFGLNQVRGASRALCTSPLLPCSAALGFLLQRSRPVCTRAQEMGAFPQPRRNSAQFPCILLQLRVHGGMRGRGRIIKAVLGNPTRLREQLRYQ
ncbi:uncharacterized protein LOC141730689 [Zonotrichia albicollis]|uniref:uncharacterized protein LOC141730689 n=1 Tax=Zonotrichia albicollis TaxID=44394 RepID=UPI003D81202D